MDSITKYRGLQYESLLLRALQIDKPVAGTSPDRRVYYLLYYIKTGVDLRETGYTKQFLDVKENVVTALEMIHSMELHQHEQMVIKRLQEEIAHIYDEDNLAQLVDRALKATERLSRSGEDY